MEEALGVHQTCRGEIRGPRAGGRSAEDFVVFGASREDAERARGVLKDGLAKRGLTLSQEQTRSVHLTEGFDFLGVTRRHDPDARTRTGYRLRITPSKKSVAKLRETLRAEWPPLLGAHVPAVLHRLHPIIRGWANYFRGRIASRVFHQLDDGRDRRARSDVRHSPPTKPWNWLLNRYGGRLTTHRADHWGGGAHPSGRSRLKFKWFPIRRHVRVRGAAAPDNGRVRAEWVNRDQAKLQALTRSRQPLASHQHGVCPVCRVRLFNGEALHQPPVQPRATGGGDAPENLRRTHWFCHQQIHSRRTTPLGSGAQGHATHLPLA